MTAAWRIAAAATFALLALQWAWGWAQPHPHLGPWVMPAFWSLLLLPAVVAFVLRRPRAPLWAGIVALVFFCDGIAALRLGGGAWAWAEVALSVAIVLAAGWPGIAARIAKRRATPPPNV